MIHLTEEQKNLERKYELAISQFNMVIEFERRRAPPGSDGEISLPQLLEVARDTFMELHVDWRAHIGDPIVDKHEIISRALIKLAEDVANGKVDL